MKIAYLISVFPKLSESFILNEIIEQLESDTEIIIFSMSEPTESIVHEQVKKYQLLQKTYYFTIKNVLQLKKTKYLINLLKSTYYEASSFRRPTNCFKLAYFATIMEDKGFSHVHTHFATMGIYAKELSDIVKVPYTLTAHAYDIYAYPRSKELKMVMEKAEAIVTISEYNKKYLENEVGIKNEIEVIRCGININQFNPQSAIKKKRDKFKILTVSRLVEKKGLEYLIKSLPLIVEENNNFEVIIVGSGPLKISLSQLVKDLKLNQYVLFKGDIPDTELLQYYYETDLFVLPCIITENGDRDGIPVAIMEAMALEIPVVSTDISGIPELIQDGISGILVPPQNEKALADSIVRLWKNKELCIQMGKCGRQIILEKYNIRNESKKLKQLFEKNV